MTEAQKTDKQMPVSPVSENKLITSQDRLNQLIPILDNLVVASKARNEQMDIVLKKLEAWLANYHGNANNPNVADRTNEFLTPSKDEGAAKTYTHDIRRNPAAATVIDLSWLSTGRSSEKTYTPDAQTQIDMSWFKRLFPDVDTDPRGRPRGVATIFDFGGNKLTEEDKTNIEKMVREDPMMNPNGKTVEFTWNRKRGKSTFTVGDDPKKYVIIEEFPKVLERLGKEQKQPQPGDAESYGTNITKIGTAYKKELSSLKLEIETMPKDIKERLEENQAKPGEIEDVRLELDPKKNSKKGKDAENTASSELETSNKIERIVDENPKTDPNGETIKFAWEMEGPMENAFKIGKGSKEHALVENMSAPISKRTGKISGTVEPDMKEDVTHGFGSRENAEKGEGAQGTTSFEIFTRDDIKNTIMTIVNGNGRRDMEELLAKLKENYVEPGVFTDKNVDNWLKGAFAFAVKNGLIDADKKDGFTAQEANLLVSFSMNYMRAGPIKGNEINNMIVKDVESKKDGGQIGIQDMLDAFYHEGKSHATELVRDVKVATANGMRAMVNDDVTFLTDIHGLINTYYAENKP